MRATGTFDVKILPQADPGAAADSLLGRMTIDKQFHGELTAVSVGQMLTGMTAVRGSAGYVAIEQVTGTLAGRSGSFILMHAGQMNRGTQSLVITVIPDSGTEQLTGLSGSMEIIIEGKQHSYRFEYTIPASS
jgi:hypothetical protein